ncbi:hypothetical protein [Qipengyuania sp. 902]|uniref:hypothetical protein n=1 Tax=Qipengyuania sp. 902 TaxID=3417565 RepID=UPI003EB7EEDA
MKYPFAVALAAVVAIAGVWLAIDRATATGPVMRVAVPHFTRIELPKTTAARPVGNEALAELDAGDAADAVVALMQNPDAARDMAAASEGNRMATGPAMTAEGLIPLRFDLVQPGSSGESVSADAVIVRKPLRIGAREIGSLPVHIDGDSRLLVDATDIVRMLERAGRPRTVRKPRRADNLLTFTELRNDGVDLRYDPNSDSLVMTAG